MANLATLICCLGPGTVAVAAVGVTGATGSIIDIILNIMPIGEYISCVISSLYIIFVGP